MGEFLIYFLSGWIILSICFYIYLIYIDKSRSIFDRHNLSKKQIAYFSFKCGIFSWFGIFFFFVWVLVSVLVLITCFIDNWIYNKLK